MRCALRLVHARVQVKSKGKAAVDVVGNLLAKSGGSIVQQVGGERDAMRRSVHLFFTAGPRPAVTPSSNAEECCMNCTKLWLW